MPTDITPSGGEFQTATTLFKITVLVILVEHFLAHNLRLCSRVKLDNWIIVQDLKDPF